MVMIARNEARAIGRALDSARTHVDRMIVLDTGSTDATREIAEACGAGGECGRCRRTLRGIIEAHYRVNGCASETLSR